MTSTSDNREQPDEPPEQLSPEVQRAVQRFDNALQALAKAPSLGKSLHQTTVFQAADQLMGSDGGMRVLAERAAEFDRAGVFHSGPWSDPSRLYPPLVAGSLQGTGVLPVLEALSELRLLAIAEGRTGSDRMTADDAMEFLKETVALNLDLVFRARTEVLRSTMGNDRLLKVERLFELLASRIPAAELHEAVCSEIRMICAQRPIVTERVRAMIDLADRVAPDGSPDSELASYIAAVRGPTKMARTSGPLAEYREAVRSASAKKLRHEAEEHASSMQETGLVSETHAVLLRQLRRRAPELLPVCLGVSESGAHELKANETLVRQLIAVAIHPATAQAIYGFSRVVDRHLLSRPEVASGLQRLADVPIQSLVKKRLHDSVVGRRDGVTANGILLGGALSVLGQPLGVGQGNMPTCQSARAISLWAQHAPAELLDRLLNAARDGLVHMRFEQAVLDSSRLPRGLATEVDPDLDPVSLVLVPHLDLLYNEIMRRVAGRGEDGHKWANPGLYGRWVPTGFASIFDPITHVVTDYNGFVRRFYATHHPSYNDGHPLVYPNPVGLFITGVHGDLIGLHAVSVQRVASGPDGDLRVYFYNPNNESRQNWGQDIRPSVQGNGEIEGESSLPFAEFLARLYAFHYNPFEEGDPYAVPDEDVDQVRQLALKSWGRSYTWAGSASQPG